MKKIVPLIILLVLIAAGLSYFFFKNPKNKTSVILTQVKASAPQITWGTPSESTQQTPSGNMKGTEISGKLKSAQATLPHFEDAKQLESEGYKPDMSLSADGPGSSVWGYKKSAQGEESIILFSYKTQPSASNPDEPLQFNCPCNMTVSVFVGDPVKMGTTSSTPGLANPASVNCTKVGGTDVIETLNNGAQYGLCQFEDNMACEEWALYRGECPVGGIKTTGYNTMGQKYCAWLGGQTFAVPNSQCKLPGGKTCSTEALYNGTCSS